MHRNGHSRQRDVGAFGACLFLLSSCHPRDAVLDFAQSRARRLATGVSSKGWRVPRFSFEAIDRSGVFVRGAMDAQTRSVAMEQLLANGQTPVSLRVERGQSALRRIANVVRHRSFNYLLFLRELGVLLKAGLPVERALNVLLELSPSGNHALRVRQILERVRNGEQLAQAIGAVITEAPRYVPRLIAAGEASGKLAEVVIRLASSLARAKSLRDKLLLSLTYPAVLAVTMVGVLYVVFTTVLPRLTPMFRAAGASLPASTEALLAVGNFVQSYGWLLLAVAATAVAAIAYAWNLPAQRMQIDKYLMASRLLLRLPNRYEAARYCRNLQTLLGGGLPLDRALAAAHDGTTNTWFRARMAEVRDSVAEGRPLRKAFAQSSALPTIAIEFSAVGEETGRLGPMLGEAADILDQEVESRLDRLTALVLPIATLVMGGLVAVIMVGIVSGVLAVNDLAR